MVEVRELTKADMKQVVELKILCWTEELAGKAENSLSTSEELDFWEMEEFWEVLWFLNFELVLSLGCGFQW